MNSLVILILIGSSFSHSDFVKKKWSVYWGSFP
jgi:hypothetical protein